MRRYIAAVILAIAAIVGTTTPAHATPTTVASLSLPANAEAVPADPVQCYHCYIVFLGWGSGWIRICNWISWSLFPGCW